MTERLNNKVTQGRQKMLRYIDDLIRNKQFRADLKRYRQSRKKYGLPAGKYVDWTPEQQKRHDWMNDELGAIIKGYEQLRRRTNRVLKDKGFVAKEKIADYYGLDNNLTNLAVAKLEGDDEKILQHIEALAEPDMCKLVSLYDNELNPMNPGEEIIHLQPLRQLFITAFPTAIAIHPRASKRDVIDFIEKKWPWIEALVRESADTKILRARKRKYSQEFLDFIWENQSLPPKELQKRLDAKFPEVILAYHEISKLIGLERERRHGSIT